MRLSAHFRRREFRCRCGCGFDTVDAALLAILEDLRDHFAAQIIVYSGARCPRHNKAVGGSAHSQHMVGKAADIIVIGTQPAEVAEYLERKYPDTCGIGRYHGWTHVDARDIKARWSG